MSVEYTKVEYLRIAVGAVGWRGLARLLFDARRCSLRKGWDVDDTGLVGIFVVGSAASPSGRSKVMLRPPKRYADDCQVAAWHVWQRCGWATTRSWRVRRRRIARKLVSGAMGDSGVGM